nr:lipoate--protein ligase [uncultured Carboxylicivirga sp.]
MLIIRSITDNPAFNIATEQFLLENVNDDCFYLYINKPSVIVGKHQNSLAEINVEYVSKNNIPVVRRLTGGGAVFHDPGNLNFSFIMQSQKNERVSFDKYLQPILKALHSLDVDAKFEGRNDLTIQGKKFSGNAKCVYNGKILQHGTLLFSSKLPDLSQALKINPLKYKDKAVKSVRNRVTNIQEHLKNDISLIEFENQIVNYVRAVFEGSEIYNLSDRDVSVINQLVDEKFGTWDWNFGNSPKYNFQKGIKTTGGHVEVNLEVQKGIITQVKLYGDFFTHGEVSEFEKLLVGKPHEQEYIKIILDQAGVENYIDNVSASELIEGMF